MAGQQPRRIVLVHKRAPGDIVVLTALVRDIALTYPGQFAIDVDTTAPDIWRHNPYITELRNASRPRGAPGPQYVNIQYGRGIRDQNYETIHFLTSFHRDFETQCKVRVPLHLPYPDIHLSPEEATVPLVNGRYWVVISGGKSDFTAKVWDPHKLQTVVNELNAWGLGVVQIGSSDAGHWHPPLENTLNLVGHTNLRDMLRLIKHADGLVCGVTGAMHMAAALQRPCVVTGGGREAWYWEAYCRENKGLAPVQHLLKMPHRFLHTIGKLDCCQHHGCWKNKTVAIGQDKSLCYHPVLYPGQPVPKCLDMIKAEHVLDAIMSYYTDGSLPPISDTPPSLEEIRAKAAQSLAVPTITVGDPFAGLPPVEVATKPVEVATLQPGPVQPAAPPVPPKRQVVPGGAKVNKVITRLANNAKLEGRPQGIKQAAVKPASRTPGPIATDPGIYDHPDVGGRFTIFALLYGGEEYFDMHKRCLNSIAASVPEGRGELRIGSNALNARSCRLVDELIERKFVTKHYRHVENARKYPVMREMFYDPQTPITTKWVLWFDDDSIADRMPNWLGVLSQMISQFHKSEKAHMFGAKFTWTMQPTQKEWIKSRPWYHNREFRLQNGQPSPSGNKIHFATGGFWALTHEALVACDIPDPLIGHNGGDYTIGEQLYQGGYNIKQFNGNKQFVNTSSVKRRGLTDAHPGTASFVQAVR